jgi:hypothetical protein
MFNRTTEELATEHSVPFTIAVDADTVCPSAPHAALTGVVGVADGVAGVPPPPPQAAVVDSRRTTSVLVFIGASALRWKLPRVRRMR